MAIKSDMLNSQIAEVYFQERNFFPIILSDNPIQLEINEDTSIKYGQAMLDHFYCIWLGMEQKTIL